MPKAVNFREYCWRWNVSLYWQQMKLILLLQLFFWVLLEYFLSVWVVWQCSHLFFLLLITGFFFFNLELEFLWGREEGRLVKVPWILPVWKYMINTPEFFVIVLMLDIHYSFWRKQGLKYPLLVKRLASMVISGAFSPEVLDILQPEILSVEKISIVSIPTSVWVLDLLWM